MTAEILQPTNTSNEQLGSEELEQDRQEIVGQAIAARTIDLCTSRTINFGDPEVALARAHTTANID